MAACGPALYQIPHSGRFIGTLVHVSVALDSGASQDSSWMRLSQRGAFQSFRGSITDPPVSIETRLFTKLNSLTST